MAYEIESGSTVAPLTPCALLCGSEIAIALHTPPHRAISLALVAQALGATEERGSRRSISALAEASSNFTRGRVAALARASSSLSSNLTFTRRSSATLTPGRTRTRNPTVPNAVVAEEGEMSSACEMTDERSTSIYV